MLLYLMTKQDKFSHIRWGTTFPERIPWREVSRIKYKKDRRGRTGSYNSKPSLICIKRLVNGHDR